jgi:hypothetical protein
VQCYYATFITDLSAVQWVSYATNHCEDIGDVIVAIKSYHATLES